MSFRFIHEWKIWIYIFYYENRVLNYDGENVTFCYNEHTDDSYHEITVTASKFITILLRHLIPENLRLLGITVFIEKSIFFHDKMVMLISREKKKIRKQLLKYEIAIQRFFKYNPYDCPKCEKKLLKSAI